MKKCNICIRALTMHTAVVKMEVYILNKCHKFKDSDRNLTDWSDYDYRNDPKFLDRQVWANSADPDQTAPRGAV